MTIRCSIVGQSNSILNYGFAAHLLTHPDIDVVNFGRVGMSSALLGPLFVQPGFCEGQHFCLIDLAMFEHSIKDNRRGRYDFEGLRKYLSHVVHTARVDKCCPVLIAFCPAVFERHGKWYAPPEAISEIVDVHREVARSEGCALFDWTTFISVLMAKDASLSTNSFYTEIEGRSGKVDGSHPKSSFQQLMANCIYEFMSEYLENERPCVTVDTRVPLYRPVMLANTDSEIRRVERMSGVIKRTFVMVDGGNRLFVNVAENEMIAGYAVNINECSGWIKFQGVSSVVKDVRFPASLRAGTMRYHVAPIFERCRPENGGYWVSSSSSGPSTEEGIIISGDDKFSSPAGIELDALILEKSDIHLQYTTNHVLTGDVDIVQLLKTKGRSWS